MKRAFFVAASILALGGAGSAPALTAPLAAAVRTAPTAPAPGPNAVAPFGCEARAPNICYFRVFYSRGDRIVILPAGMKAQKVPVLAGGDYCVALNKSPVFKCARKAVNAKYNS
jgi:hypothetical protein